MENLATIVEIVSTAITALAVLGGALWGYFRFVKGRTFKPRLSVSLGGQWIGTPRHVLLVRVGLKNIGASKITLVQRGTGFQVWKMTPRVGEGGQSVDDAKKNFAELPEEGVVVWEQFQHKFTVFDQHSWIEPGESILDDRLIDLGSDPSVTLLRLRIVCRRRILKNIVVFGRQVIPLDSALSGESELNIDVKGAPSGHGEGQGSG